MRKLLDKMFNNKKLSIIIPILISAVMYLLFVLVGEAEDKTNLIIATPIVSVIWFFGSFLVVYVQVRNPSCPERFLNICEFIAAVMFGIFGLAHIVLFIIGGFQNFNPSICIGIITYSAVAWAHSKRKE